jgi:hypothetical protein
MRRRNGDRNYQLAAWRGHLSGELARTAGDRVPDNNRNYQAAHVQTRGRQD